jgi:preprotein translocase subunit SecG
MAVLKRKWWNWQTHHLEGVAPKGVGVQIPPSAPTPLFFQLLLTFLQYGDHGTGMIILITIIHIIVCFFLIIVVLLQSGKSGDIAAAFGGMGSQTAFGPRGSATVLSKATTWSTVIFMLTSITLSIMASRGGRGSNSVLQGLKPATSNSQPAAPAKTPQK